MNKDQAVSKLWGSLIEVEDYFQRGIITQFQQSKSFGGDDALPIKKAHLVLKESEPFIPRDIFNIAESCVELAANEFNVFLNVLRKALEEPNETKKIQTVSIALEKSFKAYQDSLVPLRKAIPSLVHDQNSSSITISGNVYGQLNVAGNNIDSPAMNITLGELLRKIDESDSSSTDKTSIKTKIGEIISHPLVTSILGGVTGGIVG